MMGTILRSLVLLWISLVGVSRADGPRFIARLPQGTVELVGVTDDYRPDYKSQWWRPDGSSETVGPYKAIQNMLTSPHLKLDRIREFQLQVRPYVCVEFDNVSLQPSQRTDVTVISADDRRDRG